MPITWHEFMPLGRVLTSRKLVGFAIGARDVRDLAHSKIIDKASP